MSLEGNARPAVRIPWLALPAALIAIAASLIAGGHDGVRASTFSPTLTVTPSSTDVGVNSNITIEYELDSPSVLESAHVSFIPGDFGVADDAAIPNGARVGSISYTATESMSNGACNSSPLIGYDLFDATTNTAAVLSNTPPIPDAGWPGFADADTNDLDDAIDQYPSFLNTLFPGLTPRSRSFAWVDSGIATINRAINVLVFEPGTALPGMGNLDPALGYPVVVVYQDPTATPVASVITDECSLFRYTRQDRGVTLDNFATVPNEGGFVYRTNPATDGTYTFMEYGRSLRDLDGDGIENRLDTCVFDSTPGWDPRTSDPVNDPDGDGLPGRDDPAPGEQLQAGTGCDPTPLTPNGDPDSDGFANRQDNCPLVANASQSDVDSDQIGDACDVVVTAADGHLHEACVTEDVDIGTGGTPVAPTCPELILDQDNDGIPDTAEAHVGTSPTDPCGTDAWPLDFVSGSIPDSTNRVNILDLASFVAPVRYLNTNVGTNPGDIRWDLVPGTGPLANDINIIDLSQLAVVVPPMLEGPRAFNGPLCPYAP